MITQKYPYAPIARKEVDGKRLYDSTTGFLPSVTTILSKTKSKDTIDGLATWRERVGDKEADAITHAAATRGTAMHNILENWVKDIPPPDIKNNMFGRGVRKMANTIKTNISPHLGDIWGSEVNLAYPHLYAGTADLIGEWKGKPTIMDFKQSNKPKRAEWIEDYFLQGSAYGMAHNITYNTNIENVAIFVCTVDFQFQLFEVCPADFRRYSVTWAKKVDSYYDSE
jgi:genome maintenance exonuclease 1